jgi:hypothetical protein
VWDRAACHHRPPWHLRKRLNFWTPVCAVLLSGPRLYRLAGCGHSWPAHAGDRSMSRSPAQHPATGPRCHGRASRSTPSVSGKTSLQGGAGIAYYPAAGANPKEVAVRAGHTSVSFTLDRTATCSRATTPSCVTGWTPCTPWVERRPVGRPWSSGRGLFGPSAGPMRARASRPVRKARRHTGPDLRVRGVRRQGLEPRTVALRAPISRARDLRRKVAYAGLPGHLLAACIRC